MSRVATALPNHLRPRREKCFGDGRPRPVIYNAKARIKVYARALMKRTEPGQHYGDTDRQDGRRAGSAAMALPQCPQRALLPLLRDDRRES